MCMNVQLRMGVVDEFMSLYKCDLRSLGSGHLYMQQFICNAHFKLYTYAVFIWLW